MLSRRLTRRGYDVLLAVDGESGIEMATRQLPDLILMDIGLPTISGWDATITLKQAPATRNIPVIALTAHALASDHQRAMAVGCDDFDTKPVDLSRLLSKMETLLAASARNSGI